MDRAEHVALVYGEVAGQPDVLVRMHSKCLTGDVFGSQRCDCGPQLHRAMEIVAQAGKGVIVYLDQEGRGIGLLNKLRAYALQDARGRHRPGERAARLRARPPQLRHRRADPARPRALVDPGHDQQPAQAGRASRATGCRSSERVPLITDPNRENRGYLQVKRDKLGHLLSH